MKKTLIFSLTVVLHFFAHSQESSIEWYNKGVELKSQKKSKEALAAFKEALKLKADYTEALYETGWCQNDLKDYQGAIATLKKVRSAWPSTPKVYFELAYAFEKSGITDSAINIYKQCLKLKPDYSGVYRQLGYIQYDLDDYKTALENFQQYEVINKNPITDYIYWYRKGFCHNAIKEFESAKTSLNKSLEFKKDYLNTYLELGFASTKLKQNEEAINWFTKAIEIDPKSHIPLNGIGEVYRDNIKDMTQAKFWYQKTLSLNSNERKANYGMGYCLNSESKYSDAIPYLQKAIEQETTYTAAYVELGYSQYKMNNNYTALEHLKKAITLSPNNENARYYSTLIYISQNNKMMAQKMVDELKSLNSKHVTTLQEKVNKL